MASEKLIKCVFEPNVWEDEAMSETMWVEIIEGDETQPKPLPPSGGKCTIANAALRTLGGTPPPSSCFSLAPGLTNAEVGPLPLRLVASDN